MKERLDVLMTKRNLSRSRTAATVLIERGSVSIDGTVITKSSKEVDIESNILVSEPLAFVSRAGEKLDHALSVWNIDVKNLTAADIGSSTGGFTDCLLQRGAAKVYAIDVGTDQLDSRLLKDSRVVSMEKTDARTLHLPESVDFVCIDVSFISVTFVLEAAKNIIKKGGTIIALVKPQFEIGPGQVDKHGVVTDESKRQETLKKVIEKAEKLGLEIIGKDKSPIQGSKGNIEYLLNLKK